MKILTIAPRAVGKTSFFVSMYGTLQEKQNLPDGTQNIWFEGNEETQKNLEGIFNNYLGEGLPVPATNRLTDFYLILKQRQERKVLNLIDIEWTDTVGEETNYALNNSILFNQIKETDVCFIFYDGTVLKQLLESHQTSIDLQDLIDSKKLFTCAQTLAEQCAHYKSWKKSLAIVITKVDLLNNGDLDTLSNVLYLLMDWFKQAKCNYKICLSSVTRSKKLGDKIENFNSLRLLEWLVQLERSSQSQHKVWQRSFVYLKTNILNWKILTTSSFVFIAIVLSLFLVPQWNKNQLETPTIESNFENRF